MKQETKLVIFDLDGTLFRTETVDVEAFNRALVLNGYSRRSEDEILSLVGLVFEDMCKSLLNTEDQQIIKKFKMDVIKFEDEAILRSGELYPGVYDFLAGLKSKGFTLCICSNGNEEYVTSIAGKFHFDSLFDEIWFEKKGISKLQAVKMLKEKYRVDNFIMVGDRLCDIEAGKLNNGTSIGVTYGFGGKEPEAADYVVDSIEEIERIILGIL